MDFKRQKFFILGMSLSGYTVSEYLLKQGNTPYFYEERNSERAEKHTLKAMEKGAIRVFDNDAEEKLLSSDVLVISPGVPINHPLAILAKKSGKRIIGELEFGLNSSANPLIAVTGTNGKTTTVSLIDNLLKNANVSASLCGNVGIPLTSVINDISKEQTIVAEVSSFQLESCNIFPHIACVLNISQDHLERHYTMENYEFLKKKIFKNQTPSEYTVLNYDDEIVKDFSKETKGKVIFVSAIEKVDGVYALEGSIYYKEEFIMKSSDLALKGLHNLYNCMFSIAVACILGVDKETIATSLKVFKGIPHRLENVGEINGITFINDSKATNTASTISAIKSATDNTILILGGSEKGESYKNLFGEIKLSLVRHVVLTGESRKNMLSAAIESGYLELTVTENFESAIKVAFLVANRGDTILLSPACASFDKFTSFEERGRRFKEIVGELGCIKEN